MKSIIRLDDVQIDVNDCELLTAEEKTFNDKHLRAMHDFADGKQEAVVVKQLTAAAAVIAKRMQSRSAIAVLKFNMKKYAAIA